MMRTGRRIAIAGRWFGHRHLPSQESVWPHSIVWRILPPIRRDRSRPKGIPTTPSNLAGGATLHYLGNSSSATTSNSRSPAKVTVRVSSALWLCRYFCAFPASLGEADGDGLFAAGHSTAAAPLAGFQSSVLFTSYRAANALGRCFSVSSHVVPPSVQIAQATNSSRT
jgi:hypothetical protein